MKSHRASERGEECRKRRLLLVFTWSSEIRKYPFLFFFSPPSSFLLSYSCNLVRDLHTLPRRVFKQIDRRSGNSQHVRGIPRSLSRSVPKIRLFCARYLFGSFTRAEGKRERAARAGEAGAGAEQGDREKRCWSGAEISWVRAMTSYNLQECVPKLKWE
jgi:hypothetical protein